MISVVQPLPGSLVDCGIQAGRSGHDLKLLIRFAPPSLESIVDGTSMGAVPLAESVVRGIRALFEEAGLKFDE